MNWRHGALIVLVVGLFLFNHRVIIIQNYRDNSPILSSEEITGLEKKVESIYSTAKEKIAAGTYTPLDWQRDTYFLQVKILQQTKEKSRGFYCRERFFNLAYEACQYMVKNYYEPKRQANIFFQQKVTEAQNQVLQENGNRVDWSKFFLNLHHFMMGFLPYSFLIILIRRTVCYKLWQIKSAGDVLSVLLAGSLSVFGALAYRPDNFFQKRLDSQLQIWKEKIGTRGWRLVLAYLVAIIISLVTLFRPVKSQAQVIAETKVVCIIPMTEILKLPDETPDDYNFLFPDKITGIVRKFFEAVIKAIEITTNSFFAFLLIQLNLSPPLEFVWGLWAWPSKKISDWFATALSSRAPAFFVQFNNSLKTWTKNKGAYHENQNRIFNNLGVIYFS